MSGSASASASSSSGARRGSERSGGRRVPGQRVPVVAAAMLAAVVLPVGAAAAATPTGPTVVALWHMDEQPGDTVMVDATGSGHDGTIRNVTLGVPGDIGTAYSFDASTSIVRVPSSDDLNPGTQPLQISAHIRVPANLASGDYNVIQKGIATAIGGAYKLEIYAKIGKKFGHPDCAFNSAVGKNRVYGQTSIADGKWHVVECHLTDTQAWVTIDGNDGPKSARVVGSIANTSDLTVGGKTNNTHYFNGDLDEVAITVG
jgi:hypothetical protein